MRSTVMQLIRQPLRSHWSEDMGPMPGDMILHDLAGLLEASHARDSRFAEPRVREVIQNHYFAHEDSATRDATVIDRQLAVLIAAMEIARQEGHKLGIWSDEPAAPQMCG